MGIAARTSRKWIVAGLLVVAALIVLVMVLGPSTTKSTSPVPGGSASCEAAANTLVSFATSHHAYSATGAKDRDEFWNMHATLLASCPLSGVTYFSTHEMSTYLDR
jgi:hypothetical protein